MRASACELHALVTGGVHIGGELNLRQRNARHRQLMTCGGHTGSKLRQLQTKFLSSRLLEGIVCFLQESNGKRKQKG